MKNHPLLRSWIYYFIALIFVCLVYKLLYYLDVNEYINSQKNKLWILPILVAYFFSGVFLNIVIIRKLINENYIEYHQFSNTITNIVRDKISFLFLWVFKYPLLLLKISFIEKL